MATYIFLQLLSRKNIWNFEWKYLHKLRRNMFGSYVFIKLNGFLSWDYCTQRGSLVDLGDFLSLYLYSRYLCSLGGSELKLLYSGECVRLFLNWKLVLKRMCEAFFELKTCAQKSVWGPFWVKNLYSKLWWNSLSVNSAQTCGEFLLGQGNFLEFPLSNNGWSIHYKAGTRVKVLGSSPWAMSSA